MADFTGKKIKDTYQRVVQYHNGTLKDGLGFAISASVGSLSGSLSGSFEGHFSGSLTGSFSGTFDGATSSSFADRIAAQESFSSSLDATYATDADLNLVSSSVDSINAATSSYALSANISGSFIDLSSSLASRISGNDTDISNLQPFSSSVNSLNNATSSYALKAEISGSNTELSSSLASRIDSNDTDISNLQSFSSSLDATFATDADLNLVSSSVDSINAATSSYVDTTSIQSIGGAKTFTDNLIVSGSGNVTLTNTDITSTHLSSSFSQNYYRVEMRGEPLVVSQSHSVRANVSVNGFLDGSTIANVYASRVDIGVFNDKSGSNSVNIGNLHSASINMNSAGNTVITTNDDSRIDLITSQISASADLIVSGTIESNQKGNKIRFHYDTLGDLPSATTHHGMFAHVHGEAAAYYAHGGSWVKLADDANKVNNSATASFITNSQTGSFITNSQTGSFLTGADTGSFVTNSQTGSFQLIVTSSSPVQNTYIIPVQVDCTPSGTTFLTGSYETASILRLNYTGGNGTHTLTLPDATTTNNTYRSIRVISNGTIDNQHQVDLVPSASQTLDGGTGGFTFNRSYEGVMVWSDGTEWFQIQAKNV